MARFSVTMKRTASLTVDVGSVLTAAASPSRFKLYDLTVGSEATPADNIMLWQINRRTGTATGGTAPGIVPLDFSDTLASTLVANQAPTVNGAGSGVLLEFALNQRATFRWVAAPNGELVTSNAASNGYAASTPTPSALVLVTALFHVEQL